MAIELETRKCPKCGANVIEDAWEDLQEQADGSFVLGGYLAYVCENHCGYVQRIKETPNLFNYATSELSQDAFLCWFFEHILLENEDVAYHMAYDLLENIKATYVKIHPETSSNLENYSLSRIEQQVENIDILLTLESRENDKKVYVIIEDKVTSGESRKNQPEHYYKKLKKKNPGDIIIPVLLKTGYVSDYMQQQYEARNIVFIGYREIYSIFSPYFQLLHENIILKSWWESFYDKFYLPIEEAKSFQIDSHRTLKQYNQLSKDRRFPPELTFHKITDYLFGDVENIELKHYNFQGKGHTDWHLELRKLAWRNKKRNIKLNLNFIWNRNRYSFVIKTAPFPYKPEKRLTSTEKRAYMAARDVIKSEIKNSELVDWKITNYHLSIAQMKQFDSTPLGLLKEKLTKDIEVLTNRFDQIMAAWQ